MQRWTKAQSYEKSWWDARKDEIDFSYFRAYANDLISDCKDHIVISDSTAILEIGSGPAGICTYLPSHDKHALDPLEHFYSTVPAFTEIRDEYTSYYDGKGESLPFSAQRFDLVIMDNVLDHCESPKTVMEEIKRVLKPGGILYFRQNVYHRWGYSVRMVMEKFVLDPGHPYTFTEKGLIASMKHDGFEFLAKQRRGHIRTWFKEISSGNKKAIVRALMFVTRDRITLVVRKPL